MVWVPEMEIAAIPARLAGATVPTRDVGGTGLLHQQPRRGADEEGGVAVGEAVGELWQPVARALLSALSRLTSSGAPA